MIACMLCQRQLLLQRRGSVVRLTYWSRISIVAVAVAVRRLSGGDATLGGWRVTLRVDQANLKQTNGTK